MYSWNIENEAWRADLHLARFSTGSGPPTMLHFMVSRVLVE
jgi:hypothetical protein